MKHLDRLRSVIILLVLLIAEWAGSGTAIAQTRAEVDSVQVTVRIANVANLQYGYMLSSRYIDFNSATTEYSMRVAVGERVEVYIQPRQGYTCIYHPGDLVPANPDTWGEGNYMFTVPDRDVEINAEIKFDPQSPVDPENRLSYKLTLQSAPQGAGSVYPSSAVSVKEGDAIWVEAYANPGYRFQNWTCNGEVVGTSSYFEYTMPSAHTTLTAHYVYDPESPADPQPIKRKYPLYAEVTPRGAGNAYVSARDITEGEGYEVWVNLNPGYKVKNWVVNGEVITISDGMASTSYYGTMPEGGAEVKVVCKYDPDSPTNPNANYFNAETGELIIDDFRPGYLSSAIESLVKDFSKVRIVRVIGEMASNDYHYFANTGSWYGMVNVEVLDFSKAGGIDYVPSWAFEQTPASSILLGAGITEVNEAAFSRCQNLSSITLFAKTPPACTNYSFRGIGDKSTITLYVPLESMALYEADELWGQFNIIPISGEVRSLTLQLPEEAEDGRYRNYTIELTNLNTSVKQRYVVTDRMAYKFSSLQKGDKFSAVLYSKSGVEVARIDDIEIGGTNQTLTFANILTFHNVSAKVIGKDGADVTSQVNVEWLKSNGSNTPQHLRKGATLEDMAVGEVVICKVSLPAKLATVYAAPEEVTYTVTESDNICEVALRAFRSIQLSGKIVDSDQTPIAGANVSVRQTLNEKYTQTFVARTGADGIWTVAVYESPLTEISYSAPECISVKATETAMAEAPDTFDAGVVTLRSIVGARITYGFTYYAPGMGDKQDHFDDYANVIFEVYNITQDRKQGALSVQYPVLAVLDETINVGDQLRITAISKTGAFPNIEKTVVIGENQRAEVTFDIVGRGGITASYNSTENPRVSAMLYNEAGELVQSVRYNEGKIVFTNLPDGTYTLITMAQSDLMTAVLKLSAFEELGLKEGRDYIKDVVVVRRGDMVVVCNHVVPAFDESIFYYTSAQTSFSANKSSIVTGNYLTLRANIDFKSAYKKDIHNVVLTVDLPKACDFVAESVIQGPNKLSYTLDENNRLVIQLGDKYASEVRFCVIPTSGGVFTATASINFEYKGKEVHQPIGAAQCEIKDIEIYVPAVTPTADFVVSGKAAPRSVVTVYNGTLALATVKSDNNGNWSTRCELPNPEEGKSYMIHAVIETADGHQLETKTCLITYDPNMVLPYTISMTFYNGYTRRNYFVEWNLINKTVNRNSYDFYTTTDFTYVVKFTDTTADKVSDVVVYVKTNAGTIVPLSATYSASKGCWVAIGRFSNTALPVNASVTYRLVDEEGIYGSVCGEDGAPDVTPILDPSGYVYEAVASNRVEGVQASIYYKETKEDMYGEKYEEIVLWDAEEYAQKNPLFTDEDGMYAWDVPQGLWQVKFEKDGYQTAYSEWLPVPPPQLDVNVGIVQYKQPQVVEARAYEQGVEVQFDKYMDLNTLSTRTIFVTANGEKLAGTLEIVNAAVADPYAKADDASALRYASRVRFVPEQRLAVTTGEIRLSVSAEVASYAGVKMGQIYSQVLDVEKEVQQIVSQTASVVYGENRQITVFALPAEAAAGKTLTVTSSADMIVGVEGSTFTLDSEGKAIVTVIGSLPGHASLTYSIEGVTVTGESEVDVVREILPAEAPVASRADGSQLYRGNKVALTTETPNASIYFTTDGTSPLEADGTRRRYSVPVAIDADTDLQAVTLIEDGAAGASDISSYRYTLLRNDVDYRMNAGWNWISHVFDIPVSVNTFADPTVMRIKGQAKEVSFDAENGNVGTLTALNAAESYKVQTSADVALPRMRDIAWNPANPITLKSGLNWLGYTPTQTMSVAEAFAKAPIEAGDVIVGQEGFAEYDGENWIGTLAVMTPGLGYQYYSQSAKDIIYNTEIVSKASARRADAVSDADGKVVETRKYPDIMPVMVTLENGEGEVMRSDAFKTYAYCDTECRGIGTVINGVIVMSVYGNVGDEISFDVVEIIDNEEGTKLPNVYTSSKAIRLAENVVGSMSAPTVLPVELSVGVSAVTQDGNVQVEMIADKLNIRGVAAEDVQMVNVYSLDGQTLLHVDRVSEGGIRIYNLTPGVYAVVVKANGIYSYHKIVKRN